MNETQKKPLTAAQKRQRALKHRAWLRAGVQAFFFLSMPGAFVAGFSGVKHLFQWIGAGELLRLDSFVLSLIGLCGFTVLFDRFFCGYVCSFGGLGDFVYWLSGLVQKKLLHRKKQFRLPERAVRWGQKVKYLLLALIAVLCALGVAARAAFFMLPQFKPVVALTIISGVAFGGETGFLVGAMTMLASNFLFSQGPWTPFQMFAAGIIGFLAGVLFRKGWLRRSRAALCSYGAIAAIVLYGGLMNPVAALLSNRELSWQVLMSYYITGFPVDCVHATATVFFLWVLAEPMLEKLDRIKTKYGLVE